MADTETTVSAAATNQVVKSMLNMKAVYGREGRVNEARPRSLREISLLIVFFTLVKVYGRMASRWQPTRRPASVIRTYLIRAPHVVRDRQRGRG